MKTKVNLKGTKIPSGTYGEKKAVPYSCQLVCKIVIGKKDTNFQVFQYRPVQLSYPKLENEVNILDFKDNPALSTCLLVKSETTKVTKTLRNE